MSLCCCCCFRLFFGVAVMQSFLVVVVVVIIPTRKTTCGTTLANKRQYDNVIINKHTFIPMSFVSNNMSRSVAVIVARSFFVCSVISACVLCRD